MASSPDSGLAHIRRRRAQASTSQAAPRISPRPSLPTPTSSNPSSNSSASDSEESRGPLPSVRVPAFPSQTRSQGKKKRNSDAQTPSPRHRMTKKKRHSYTATEKLHWLKMQELQPDLSNRKLARMANVQQCQIREWKKLAERLKVSAGCRCRLAGGGRKAKYPPMERAIYREFLAARSKGLPEEEEDVTHPNPFYEDPEEVAARASPQTAAEQEVHADRSLTNEEDNTDKEDNDDDDMADQYYVDEADEGAEGADSDLEDEWWAPGHYEGEEVEEWVAGADDS
ncbi:unnamed protein product [Closterium sp. NIES-64]|nr:unnamed protein product [Closterium sp. NIES-64]